MTKPGPTSDVSDEELLRAIRRIYGPAVNASDVADEVGLKRQTVDRRLRQLNEQGLVETRMLGQSRAWWLSTEGKKRILK